MRVLIEPVRTRSANFSRRSAWKPSSEKSAFERTARAVGDVVLRRRVGSSVSPLAGHMLMGSEPRGAEPSRTPKAVVSGAAVLGLGAIAYAVRSGRS